MAALAVPVFALSAAWTAQVNRDARLDEFNKTLIAEFSAISEMTRGKRVLVASPPEEWDFNSYGVLRDSLGHYLAGVYVKGAYDCDVESEPPGYADFFEVSRHRDGNLNLLTPEHRLAFLYGRTDPLELCRSEFRALESRQPAARSEFDVHLKTGYPPALHYFKRDCSARDYETPFFAYFYPNDPRDLADEFAQDGFEGISPVNGFTRRARFDDACLMTLHLWGRYDGSALIRTGQYISGGERLWEVDIIPPMSAERIAGYERIYRETASGEPAARSVFNLHLDGGALIYLKQPCTEDDTRGRFLLSVQPADLADLPAERRDIGHASLNFDFAPPHGAIFDRQDGGKCMAILRLPDYGIVKIETGQWIPGGERLWDAEIAVGE